MQWETQANATGLTLHALIMLCSGFYFVILPGSIRQWWEELV